MDLLFHTKGFLITIIISCALFSCAKSSPISPVNVTAEGVAIKGYDPMAYFADGKPIRGLPELKTPSGKTAGNLNARNLFTIFAR